MENEEIKAGDNDQADGEHFGQGADLGREGSRDIQYNTV
jgi:hypothetical protein